MSKLKKFVRANVSRFFGGVAAGVAAWIGLPEAMVGEFETAAVTTLTFAVYGIVHRVLDALGINPEDSAA